MARGRQGAEQRGETLSAFDLAEHGLGEHPDDLWLKCGMLRSPRHARSTCRQRALVLADRPEFACDYVSDTDAAKDYGRVRMYRLRRSAPAPARA